MMLENLSQDELSKLEKVGRLRSFGKDDIIVEEGDSGSSFFLLLSGKAEVRKSVGLVTFRRLMELEPCSIFGEICFLGAAKRSASVVAMEACKVLEFFRSDFDTFAGRNPAIALKIYHGIAQELAERLIRNNEELRKALLWALDEVRNRTNLKMPHKSLEAVASEAAEALHGVPDTAMLGIEMTTRRR